MLEIILNDKNTKPTDAVFKSKVGSAFKYYKEIENHILKNYDSIKKEWKYYGQKNGWLLKIFYKNRNLLFIIPSKSFFRIVFVFGDRAVKTIEESEIKDYLKEAIKAARKYAEGRSLSIDIKDDIYIEDIKSLIEIKKTH